MIEALVGFPNENGLGIAAFITNGVLDRFPRLRIAFSHGGGSFPMILPRLQHGWEISKPLREAIPSSPQEVARQFWYDTLVYSEPALTYLMQVYGTSQLMIGTDYPFVIRDSHPGRRLEGLGLSAVDREALQTANCLRFLGL
ncbi:Amidohydrolase [compost metagenome]